MSSKNNRRPVRKRDCPREIGRDPGTFFGKTLDPEQFVFVNTVWNKDIDIVFVSAPAGTGKSFCAAGVSKLLVDYGRFENIVYIMSPYGERQQGWLPGSIEEKSAVYFDAFYQALQTIGVNLHTDVVQEADEKQKGINPYINCITDTFLRGTNLNDSVVIIDEAQNFTIPQLKKILTRIGDHSKVIVIGHHLQCDLYDPKNSGFLDYIEHFRGQERCAICELKTNHRGWISRHADSFTKTGMGVIVVPVSDSSNG